LKKLGYHFSQVLAFFWSFFPWWINIQSAKFLAFLWLDIFKIRKDIINNNLEIVFPRMSDVQKQSIAQKSMRALCRSFVDVLRIPYLTDEWINQNVIFDGTENIKKIQQLDSGLFFLSLHLGSGDLGAAVFSQQIRPITIISKRIKNKFLDAFWFGLRKKSKSLFIDAHAKNNAFEILAALKKKRGVIFVLDQFMGKPYGIESQFFGVTTGTAYGLALFAKKTQLPIYPLYTYWDDHNKLHVCVDEAIDLRTELSENNEVILKAMTNKFNQTLEKIITRHPEHWMWVHKRWKIFL